MAEALGRRENRIDYEPAGPPQPGHPAVDRTKRAALSSVPVAHQGSALAINALDGE